MPRSLTAATGIYTLSYGIKAYISVEAQPMGDVVCFSERVVGKLPSTRVLSKAVRQRLRESGSYIKGNSNYPLIHKDMR